MAGDDSTHIRQALTYVIPAATIIDFYTESDSTPIDAVREFYGEDTVAELRKSMSRGTSCVTGRSSGSGN